MVNKSGIFLSTVVVFLKFLLLCGVISLVLILVVCLTLGQICLFSYPECTNCEQTDWSETPHMVTIRHSDARIYGKKSETGEM